MIFHVYIYYIYIVMKVKGLKRRIKSKYKTISRFARINNMDPKTVHNLLKRAEANRGINHTKDNLEALIKDLENRV